MGVNIRDVLKKEIEVAVHAQTLEFRLAKYILITAFIGVVYWLGGWAWMWKVLLLMFVGAIALHLYYRRMTEVWTKAWGGFMPLSREGRE